MSRGAWELEAWVFSQPLQIWRLKSGESWEP